MLWDVEKKEVGCNESYDIIEFFNSGLNGLARNPGLDLSPKELKGKIGEWNGLIYPNVNNGVYRQGFDLRGFYVFLSLFFVGKGKMDL
jgi:putative glutathione S-transferase